VRGADTGLVCEPFGRALAPAVNREAQHIAARGVSGRVEVVVFLEHAPVSRGASATKLSG